MYIYELGNLYYIFISGQIASYVINCLGNIIYPYSAHIIFAFSGIRRPSRLVSGHFKEKYLSYVYEII